MDNKCFSSLLQIEIEMLRKQGKSEEEIKEVVRNAVFDEACDLAFSEDDEGDLPDI